MPEWSDPIVKVYEDCTDAILVNIARHFPVGEEVSDTFSWQARKLAEMGQLTQENAAIIARMTGQNVERVQQALSGAASDALKDVEPELAAAAEKGFLPGAPSVDMSPRMENILSSYSAQAVNQLNLVNTVMLDSSLTAFQRAVSDTVVWEQRAMTAVEKQAAQQILNSATAEVATGVTAHQSAVRKAIKQMADAGLTGFVDRGGHNWTPEAYVRMDIRTTCGNVATQSVFARNADYGNDLIWVRTKAAARPLCFPWQGKVLSKDGRSGVTEDLRGNKIPFVPLSSTSYGEPAGLFGINCGHVPPNPFVPGFSMVRGAIDVDDPEIQKENDRLYAMSQEQRALERAVREAKRDAAMANATGDKDMFDKYAAQVKKAQDELRAFTKANNLADRTYLSQVVSYDRSVAAKATWSARKAAQAASPTAPAAVPAAAQTVATTKTAAAKAAQTAAEKSVIQVPENKEYAALVQNIYKKGNSKARSVWEKTIPPGGVVSDFSFTGTPHYNPVTESIKLDVARDAANPRGKGLTYFHEHGHAIDDLAGRNLSGAPLSSDPEFLAALKTDLKAARAATGAKGARDQDFALSVTLSRKPDYYNGVSDIMGGLTYGKAEGNWGHKASYWRQTPEHLPKEAFAHMTEAAFFEEQRGAMEEYFPTAWAKYQELLEKAL